MSRPGLLHSCDRFVREAGTGARRTTTFHNRRPTPCTPIKEEYGNETTWNVGDRCRGRCGRSVRLNRGRRFDGGREDAGSELQEHAQDRLHRTVHRWRRLPRQRAAQLGEVRSQDARSEVRSEDQAHHGRYPRRAGSRDRADDRSEVHLGQDGRCSPRAVDVGQRCRVEPGVLQCGPRPYLAVCNAHVADEGCVEGGHGGVLPGRSG